MIWFENPRNHAIVAVILLALVIVLLVSSVFSFAKNATSDFTDLATSKNRIAALEQRYNSLYEMLWARQAELGLPSNHKSSAENLFASDLKRIEDLLTEHNLQYAFGESRRNDVFSEKTITVQGESSKLLNVFIELETLRSRLTTFTLVNDAADATDTLTFTLITYIGPEEMPGNE